MRRVASTNFVCRAGFAGRKSFGKHRRNTPLRRTRSRHTPKWKPAIALACAAYMILVWVLPIFMLPFVNVLPFVHERGYWERLLVSGLGSVLVIATLASLAPRRALRDLRSGEPAPGRKRALHWLGVGGGLAAATVAAAALSPNLFGLVACALPGEAHRETIILEAVEHSGSRYRSVALQYASPADGTTRYLVLSKRLFDYPRFAPGDALEFRGHRTAVGFYVSEFRLSPGPMPAPAEIPSR